MELVAALLLTAFVGVVIADGLLGKDGALFERVVSWAVAGPLLAAAVALYIVGLVWFVYQALVFLRRLFS
jgi:hypothetical protein